jgi:hypothetical protein
MNERIEVGDFVEVYRWPCCGRYVGHKFIVSELETGRRGDIFVCGPIPYGCGMHHEYPALALDKTVPPDAGMVCCVPAHYLRKLPPLADPETTTTREALTA